MTPQETTQAIPMVRIPKSAAPVPTSPTHRSRPLPVRLYAGGALLLAVALLVGAQQLGWYGTSGRGNAGEGEGGRVALTSGQSIGLDVKGWMTVQDVLDAFPVTRDALYAQFSLPASTPTDSRLGELSEASGGTFDIPALRDWLDGRG